MGATGSLRGLADRARDEDRQRAVGAALDLLHYGDFRDLASVFDFVKPTTTEQADVLLDAWYATRQSATTVVPDTPPSEEE